MQFLEVGFLIVSTAYSCILCFKSNSGMLSYFKATFTTKLNKRGPSNWNSSLIYPVVFLDLFFSASVLKLILSRYLELDQKLICLDSCTIRKLLSFVGERCICFLSNKRYLHLETELWPRSVRHVFNGGWWKHYFKPGWFLIKPVSEHKWRL